MSEQLTAAEVQEIEASQKRWRDEMQKKSEKGIYFVEEKPTLNDGEIELETFDGVVDAFLPEEGVATITLTMREAGDTLLGEIQLDKIPNGTLREGRRFEGQTVLKKTSGNVRIVIRPIPDNPMTEAQEAAMDAEIDELLED